MSIRVGAVVSAIALGALAGSGACFADGEVHLETVSRFESRKLMIDHLLGVEQVLEHHALVSSYEGIGLVDLDTLSPNGGEPTYVDYLDLVDIYSTVTRSDGYVYANLRRYGFGIAHLDAQDLSLSYLGSITEPGVFYDNMTLVGDRLYVPAHAFGIRIFDVSAPASPVLIGSLEEGFDDAFHIAVDGTTAYVADGAGGLKIVDLSDETAPVIVAGETTDSAAGTAEHALFHAGRLYVACGGAGVAVYEPGDLATRVLHDTPICAKALAVVGDFLAVADIGGLELFAIELDGTLSFAARESGARRYLDNTGEPTRPVRLWHGISPWGDDRVVVANWDWVDVYRIVDASAGTQADISASSQRLRFEPTGGTKVVQLSNDGSNVLNITVTSDTPTFTASLAFAQIQPGDVLDVTINYAGGQPGAGLLVIYASDPDESPFPIELFGSTPYLDPGEPAIPFTLESWTYDHDTDEFLYGELDLDACAGRLVYFHVFSSW